MLLGFGAHRFAFLFSAITGLLAFLCIAVGAVIWTVLLHRVRSAINGATVANGTPLGLHVSWGDGLWIAWAAAGAALLSVIPCSLPLFPPLEKQLISSLLLHKQFSLPAASAGARITTRMTTTRKAVSPLCLCSVARSAYDLGLTD